MIGSAKWIASVRGLTLVALLSGTGMVRLHAQPKPKVVLPPTVEGDWVRTDEIGVGEYAGFELHMPKPVFTPEGQELLNKAKPASGFDDISKKVGNVYVVRPHPCIFAGNGAGAIEFNSAGFHAIQSKTEFAIDNEGVGNLRHIYLDGRPLPTHGTRTPSNTGYSVGHIEADGTLVVETTDIIQSVPGGGVQGAFRRPESVVTQRFEPSADGTKLKIVYTWTDPKVYAQPYTYVFTFERMAPDAIALDHYCDATDPLESQSVVPPDQK